MELSINARARRDQARPAGAALKAEALARGAEADLHLRAYRHPFEESAERLGQQRVVLVPAVEAHFLTHETAAPEAEGRAS